MADRDRAKEYVDAGTTTHTRHMGFKLELAHLEIINALAWVPEEQRACVIDHLAPAKLQRAVRETLDG